MIYFIQEGLIGPIKIGHTTLRRKVFNKKYTKNPIDAIEERLRQLQVGNPRQLYPLGYIKGGVREEKKLHKQFDPFRMKGEWFHPDNEVLRQIHLLIAREYE